MVGIAFVVRGSGWMCSVAIVVLLLGLCGFAAGDCCLVYELVRLWFGLIGVVCLRFSCCFGCVMVVWIWFRGYAVICYWLL